MRLLILYLLSMAIPCTALSEAWLERSAPKRGTTVELAERELKAGWRGKERVEMRLDESMGEGFRVERGKRIVVTGGATGLLYGAFHLLRCQRAGLPIDSVEQKPRWPLRILNHWDNLDGSIERGYAGRSLWWGGGVATERLREYARLNASVGINAVVLNNVNAAPEVLNITNLERAKELADLFRPWGIRVFLSVNFASPSVIGGQVDSDPLRPEVARWWAEKASEIYAMIPDFGGFLVKANSEGQAGPHDYGRSHAQGANVLADALKPHGGVVMWRAFVYAPDGEDRAKQAYRDFVPLDGQFRDNVIVQIKNGPIDFQPREPINPLFGAMPQSRQMMELQITQEYLGQQNHLVYLAPMFGEALDSAGEGLEAVAGVANTGDEANWCGHDFAAANWYAFGRLAWNPSLNAEQIAREWLCMTFSADERFVEPVAQIMLGSREAAVDYMMPLGLHHLFAWEHHYGPQPWCDVKGARADWMPRYYHQAGADGIGFDRTRGGSAAVDQYSQPLADLYNDRERCPEKLLLWFHHVPWDWTMSDGRTLWDNLRSRYQAGVDAVQSYRAVWRGAEDFVDRERFERVKKKLDIQARDAIWWRDACLGYFRQFHSLP